MTNKHTSLMRRAVPAIAIAGVAGGFVAVLDHPSTSPLGDAGTSDSAAAPSTTTPSTAGSSSSPAGSASTTTTQACTGTTVEGSSVSTRYGTVQVSAEVASDGRLCDIAIERAPSGGRSGSITSRAAPVLRQRALSAQSARFDGVSGATYTSRAYKQSLQAILDAS
jgi:uncharacterized protein with FMN-binding domain